MLKIISAAILYENQHLYTGRYHSECFTTKSSALDAGLHIECNKRPTQGFLDNLGNFQDRIAAWKIAFSAKQIIPIYHNRKPEDLLPKINTQPQLDSVVLIDETLDLSLARKFADICNTKVIVYAKHTRSFL
jgi:hypothetical protein